MADLTQSADDKAEGEGTSGEDLHKEAKERYQLAWDGWSANLKAALEDMKFRAGDQWPDDIKASREKSGRPCLVVDKVNQYIRQVVNDGRQNRPAVKVRPVDDQGDEKVADALQGIIRNICDKSDADTAFDTALDHAASSGFGYFRVLTDYAHEHTFNQEIQIGRIRNPRAVLLDPNIQKADGSDARYGFVIDEIPKAVFKKQYPKAKFTDFTSNTTKYSDGWLTADNVRVAEYFYVVEEQTNLHLLADGTSSTEEDYQNAVAKGAQVAAIVETRSIPVCRVKWCRLSGAEILEKNDWLGKYIPIVPVFGNEYDIDGKVIYSGLIRAAKDAMRLYNYSRSAYAERVALTPKAPWVAAAGQVEGHDEWEDANQENYSVLVYDPIDVNGTPLPPPQRQSAADIPEGFARDMQLSEHDIQGSMGMYAASVGQPSNEKSGRAIMARVKEGDTATFHYQDNLNRAIKHLGRILVDLIPKIYDSKRVVRLLGEDGASTEATVDPKQETAVEQQGEKVIYNLNIGLYDVSVSAGPSYSTRRQEAAEAMIQLSQANPAILPIGGDIMVRNMDWPGAEELADRMKLMLPPQILQAEQAKGTNAPSPEIQAMLSQASEAVKAKDQQIQEMGQVIQQAQQQVQSLEQQVKNNADRADVDRLKLDVEKYKAETERLQIERAAATPGTDTSGLEERKLELEDEWKKLEARTRVIVAKISAHSKGATPGAAPGATDTTGIEAPQTDFSGAEIDAPSMEQALAALAQKVESSVAESKNIAAELAQMIQASHETLSTDINTLPTITRQPDGSTHIMKGKRGFRRAPDGSITPLQ